MSNSNAARVQGAGPSCTDGDPIQVCVQSLPPPTGCVQVEGCPDGDPVIVNIPDCGDETEGCINDAAVTGDNPGTVNAHLRGLNKIFPTRSDQAGTNQPPSEVGDVNSRMVFFDITDNLWESLKGQITTDGNAIQSRAPIFIGAVYGQEPFGNALYGLKMSLLQDNQFANVNRAAITASCGYRFDATANAFVLDRAVNTFKTVATAANGNTALWTPAGGKKFRLMRYMVEVTGDAAFAGAAVLTITLNDAGAAIGLGHDVFIPLAAAAIPGVQYQSPWIDLGNGILSAAANNVLNVNLSAALAAGNVRVIACGTEE